MGFISNDKVIINFYQSIGKQLLYAGGLALNDTSIMATKNVQKELQAEFDITTSWAKAGNKYGARKSKPEKTKTNVSQYVGILKGGSANTLRTVNEVSGKDHWIYDHETGAIRRAKDGGDILIPTKALLQKVKTTKGRVGRKRVSKLLDKNKNHIFQTKINGNDYIMGRPEKKVPGKRFGFTPTGRRSKRKLKVYQRPIPLFLIKKQVKEKKTFHFVSNVMGTFNDNFKTNFSKRFREAVRTMRVHG